VKKDIEHDRKAARSSSGRVRVGKREGGKEKEREGGREGRRTDLPSYG
jgi:hypothetical protein